jgi:hypothetical protein
VAFLQQSLPPPAFRIESPILDLPLWCAPPIQSRSSPPPSPPASPLPLWLPSPGARANRCRERYVAAHVSQAARAVPTKLQRRLLELQASRCGGKHGRRAGMCSLLVGGGEHRAGAPILPKSIPVTDSRTAGGALCCSVILWHNSSSLTHIASDSLWPSP